MLGRARGDLPVYFPPVCLKVISPASEILADVSSDLDSGLCVQELLTSTQ